jgi:hypothetical protein
MRRAVFHILTAGIVFSLSHGVISAQVWGMITGRVMTRLERRLLPERLCGLFRSSLAP